MVIIRQKKEVNSGEYSFNGVGNFYEREDKNKPQYKEDLAKKYLDGFLSDRS